MHLAIAHTGPALRTPTHGAAMAGAMTRVTGPAAEAWRPQIQNGDTNSESIPNMYKVQYKELIMQTKSIAAASNLNFSEWPHSLGKTYPRSFCSGFT